jgi:transposase
MGYEVRRYSEAFKQQVIEDVEKNVLSMNEAAQKYGIGACHTISRWLRERGKTELVPKVVRVETVSDRQQVKELLAEKQRLESALAQSQLKIMVLEEVIKVAEEEYHVEFKKKPG